MTNRLVTVADLDTLTPVYKVVDEYGRIIGEKRDASLLLLNKRTNEKYIYLKPEYTKAGSHTGGKGSRLDARLYRNAPPWVNCP